jgi:hypothetical protein
MRSFVAVPEHTRNGPGSIGPGQRRQGCCLSPRTCRRAQLADENRSPLRWLAQDRAGWLARRSGRANRSVPARRWVSRNWAKASGLRSISSTASAVSGMKLEVVAGWPAVALLIAVKLLSSILERWPGQAVPGTAPPGTRNIDDTGSGKRHCRLKAVGQHPVGPGCPFPQERRRHSTCPRAGHRACARHDRPDDGRACRAGHIAPGRATAHPLRVVPQCRSRRGRTPSAGTSARPGPGTRSAGTPR